MNTQDHAAGRTRHAEATIAAREFIDAIFKDAEGVVVLVSAEEGFARRRYDPDNVPTGRTYFAISTVKDVPRARVLSATTADLVKSYVIVLDDIGTKVSREAASLFPAPSYRLETSSGNEQWGYLFREGVDPARAAALIEALAQAGYTDPGATRADRIMRMPGSLNDKHGEPFHAALLEWDPERRFTFSELALAFGVVPTDTPTATDGPVGLEPGETDPVFEWLQAHGQVIKGPNPRGWYAVHCPWEAEHSGEVDRGTDYLPGRPGAFKCMHSHGKEKNTAALTAWIKEQDPTAELGPIDMEQLAALALKLQPLAAAAKLTGSIFGPPQSSTLFPASPYGLHGEAYEPPDPATLPRRPWLMKPSYMRGEVSILGAPGGTGKSSLVLTEALSLVTGRPLLGRQPLGQIRVLLVNVEDSRDEMDLRIAATMRLHNIKAVDLGDRLFVVTEGNIVLVRRDGGTAKSVQHAIDELVSYLIRHEIDVLVLDPLAMLHHAEENSNEEMAMVIAALREIARRAKVAIRVVHHTRKLGGAQADVDSFRGASSLIAHARQADVINTMSADEARTYGIPEEERTRHFRLSNAKFNYGPREGDEWYQTTPMELPNGETVAAVANWKPPVLNLDYDTVSAICKWLSENSPARKSPIATNWFGWKVAEFIGADGWQNGSPRNVREAAKAGACRWIGAMERGGVIVETKGRNNSRDFPAYQVGHLPTREQWEMRAAIRSAQQ